MKPSFKDDAYTRICKVEQLWKLRVAMGGPDILESGGIHGLTRKKMKIILSFTLLYEVNRQNTPHNINAD
ncbi:hypothetical protein N7478_000289 [Penicillium angulare]|uniref:uncharacterized protein n=1 Tax=Penicillium angulare TaxID=116970 RepID=UPI0025405A94|nr:uncharacterized protein N7478_000289 [Penicillium angulare]KAJ5291038.1 hypothetical protein N7478_000289 [Penicillium angulare]